MSVTITIPESSPHFAAVLALLAGTSATAIAAPQTPPAIMQPAGGGTPMTPPNADDDESQDVGAVAGQTDKNGLPWDARIHSDPPKLTGKSEWRKKRGVTDAEVTAVEAELRQRAGTIQTQQPVPQMPAPVQQPAVAPTMPTPAAFDPSSMPAMTPPVAAMQPYAPQMPAPVQPQPEPAAFVPTPTVTAAPTDFQGFMTHITQQMAKTDASGLPLITADVLTRVAGQTAAAFNAVGHNVQLSVITDIASHPLVAELTAYATQLMQQEGRW